VILKIEAVGYVKHVVGILKMKALRPFETSGNTSNTVAS